MTFPTTGILDNFNRANGAVGTASSGETWTDFSAFYAAGGLNVSSNECVSSSPGTRMGDYISSSTYGPDTEAYCTIVTAPTADGETVDLWVRLNVGTLTGYFIRWAYASGGADTWTLIRRDTGGNVTLATNTTEDLVPGTDKIGIEIIGTVIKVYHWNGTAWNTVITYDTAGDATKYATSGSIALGVQDNAVDDFGGGTVVTANQKVQPTADSVDGNWLNESGSNVNLYASIDESSANDTNYITSEVSPANSGVRLKLGSLVDPLSSTGHVLHWRPAKDASGGREIDMTIKLYQGGGDVLGAGTLIASFTRTNVDLFGTFDETLSGAQADSITDYTALYIEFYANQV